MTEAAAPADVVQATISESAAIRRLNDAREKIVAQLSQVIVGQADVIEELLICLFGRGHCLLEGVPGLAKTLMISTLARTLNLSFSRIQFTPDLMPADITGTEILEENRSDRQPRAAVPAKGRSSRNIILADEINRTPPKTQAALLEAMQERQVTVGRVRHPLTDPFFVLATQNPIEQEGTYPLPEAQQDRFMFKVFVNYPNFDEEFEVARRTTAVADRHDPAGAQRPRRSSSCSGPCAKCRSATTSFATPCRSCGRRASARPACPTSSTTRSAGAPARGPCSS